MTFMAVVQVQYSTVCVCVYVCVCACVCGWVGACVGACARDNFEFEGRGDGIKATPHKSRSHHSRPRGPA